MLSRKCSPKHWGLFSTLSVKRRLRRVAEGDRTSFWQAVIVDLFSGGPARWDSSCGAASLQVGIDACGTRGDFQRYYGTSIGPVDLKATWPRTLDGEPGNEPQWRL